MTKSVHMVPIPFTPTDYSLPRNRARTATRNTISIPRMSMTELIYGNIEEALKTHAEPRVIKREELSARLAMIVDVRGMNSAGVKALRRAVK